MTGVDSLHLVIWGFTFSFPLSMCRPSVIGFIRQTKIGGVVPGSCKAGSWEVVGGIFGVSDDNYKKFISSGFIGDWLLCEGSGSSCGYVFGM